MLPYIAYMDPMGYSDTPECPKASKASKASKAPRATTPEAPGYPARCGRSRACYLKGRRTRRTQGERNREVGTSGNHSPLHTHTHTYIYIYMYIYRVFISRYLYIYMRVYVRQLPHHVFFAALWGFCVL